MADKETKIFWEEVQFRRIESSHWIYQWNVSEQDRNCSESQMKILLIVRQKEKISYSALPNSFIQFANLVLRETNYWHYGILGTNYWMNNQPTISRKSDRERKFQALRNVVTQMLLSFLTGPASNKSILLRYKRLWSTSITSVCHCIKANGHTYWFCLGVGSNLAKV